MTDTMSSTPASTPALMPMYAEVRPVPDPTILTTQQLLREVASCREVFDHKIEGLAGRNEERFHAIDTRLVERETRFLLQHHETKEAIKVALAVVKESRDDHDRASSLAIGKSDAAFTKQIDQTTTQIVSMGRTLDDKIGMMNGSLMNLISDLKDRVTIIEATKKGGGEVWGVIGTIGGIVVGALATAASSLIHR